MRNEFCFVRLTCVAVRGDENELMCARARFGFYTCRLRGVARTCARRVLVYCGSVNYAFRNVRAGISRECELRRCSFDFEGPDPAQMPSGCEASELCFAARPTVGVSWVAKGFWPALPRLVGGEGGAGCAPEPC